MENINYTDDPVGLHQDPQEEYIIQPKKNLSIDNTILNKTINMSKTRVSNEMLGKVIVNVVQELEKKLQSHQKTMDKLISNSPKFEEPIKLNYESNFFDSLGMLIQMLDTSKKQPLFTIDFLKKEITIRFDKTVKTYALNQSNISNAIEELEPLL